MTSPIQQSCNVVLFTLFQRQVYLCVIFLKIGEIDTIKEQYAADVLIKAKWRETEMDTSATVVSTNGQAFCICINDSITLSRERERQAFREVH